MNGASPSTAHCRCGFPGPGSGCPPDRLKISPADYLNYLAALPVGKQRGISRIVLVDALPFHVQSNEGQRRYCRGLCEMSGVVHRASGGPPQPSLNPSRLSQEPGCVRGGKKSQRSAGSERWCRVAKIDAELAAALRQGLSLDTSRVFSGHAPFKGDQFLKIFA